MIFFAEKANTFFNELLRNVFNDSLPSLEYAIETNCREDQPYFNDEIIDLFGGMKKLGHHLKSLKYAQNDTDNVYEISDYSFLLLDRLLTCYCEIYNHFVKEIPDYEIEINGKKIRHINLELLFDDFFWDNDYDLKPDIFNQLSDDNKKESGFNEELFGVVNRMVPHPDEITPKILKDFNLEKWHK